jgi:hypothetical protein
MSMKNSNDTIWNQTSDLPICSTVHIPQYITLIRAMSQPKSVTTAKFFLIQYFATGSGADTEPKANNLQAVTHILHYGLLTGHQAA